MLRQLGVLALGLGAIVAAMAAGGVGPMELLLQPPRIVGVMLGAAAALIALVVVLRATEQMRTSQGDPRELIRAVRLLFLAVGVGAVSARWFIGSPVPIVAGLVIIGIDVLETTFLLLVTAARGR
jgi:hypothetical protein